MLTHFLSSLGLAPLSHAASTGTGIAVVIAAICLVLAAISLRHAQSLQRRLAATRQECDQALDLVKATSAKERELGRKAEERNEELRALKQENAVLRKKNHTAQEEAKALRKDLQKQSEERQRLLVQKPAFADPPPRPAPARPSPDPVASKTDVPAALPPKDPAREEELARLTAEREELAAKLAAAEEAKREQKAELARLTHHVEQLRRIDIISKGKVEVLEDRVAGLGRQYYEAVSELAVLKGEVKSPLAAKHAKARKQEAQRDKTRARRGGGEEPAPEAGEDANLGQ